MGLLDFLGLGTPAPPLPTPPPAPTEAQLRAEAGAAIDAYVAELIPCWDPAGYIPPRCLREVPSAARILGAPPEQQARMLALAWERSRPGRGETDTEPAADAFSGLMDVLLREAAGLRPEHLVPMIEAASRPASPGTPAPRLLSLMSAVRSAWRQPGGPERLMPALEVLGRYLRAQSPVHERRRAVEGIRELLTGSPYPLPWADRVLRAVEEMEDGRRGRWRALYARMQAASTPAPSARWLTDARGLRAALGDGDFRATTAEWLPWIRDDADYQLPSGSGDLARGLVWLLADGGDGEARAIGDLGLLGAHLVPGQGLRSVKLLNACLSALGGMDSDEAMAQISRIRARAKHVQARRLVEDALRAAAARRGMQPEELEEIVVPTFGMDEPGVLRETFDGWTAEVRVTGTAEVETAWIRADGKRQKGVPAAVKAEHADAVKELKAAAAEMEKMLAAQRERLEALPLEERAVPFAAWRERYLDHPLLAQMCRRLVWRLETDGRTLSCAWLDGRLVGPDDAPLEPMGDATVVRPWHPVGVPADEVAAWRAWLDRHGVSQPFKQAHREIYVLTDAERETRLFSNRFAGHFLKQHVFSAVARGCGWRHHPVIWGRPPGEVPFPSLRLERYRLVAEFVVAGVNDVGPFNGAMTAYVSTDQLRFLDLDGQLVPLRDVPPRVLSEVLRDVDLFVAVASVATDPEWSEREHDHPQAAYWRAQSFGDLTATAVTRREVLQRVLPRLRIAPVCSLDERWLVVRGQRRTYRIHLGSGSVLMEPNGQYLCIVPAGGARDPAAGIVLPFEGDSLLTVILSKAFLLADDTKITDGKMLSQILHR